ncbi:KIN14B-interacting protein At4g14310 [Sesamum indicum]|uniref:KIN14B-interacting protein At4g14310 n=1 Tax=Sesamum indicum TaxID=4182 RepID=A0A6I9STV3_SESIN|nr:KIN14B-interacting protein At4g14310 [Sesamum indicum]
MSTSSVRRIKERAGGGAKIAAAPTGKISPGSGKSISAGKENPRPTSRVRAATQKHSIRPMARIDKSPAAQVVVEPRSRWSTSSAPRDRSSSPSEFTRVLSDLRKNSSRVSLGPPQSKVSGVGTKCLNEKSGKCVLEKRVLKDLVKDGENLGELEGNFQETEKIDVRVVNNGTIDRKEESVRSVLRERQDLEKRVSKDFAKNGGNLEELEVDFQENEKINVRFSDGNSGRKDHSLSSISGRSGNLENEMSSLESHLESNKVPEEVSIHSHKVGVLIGLSSRESKIVNRASDLPGVMRENVPDKCSSKLQEKLAFLEGKVKRIASDIKRTKEMLDMNNADASKMILCDIQEKITGIEKAMGHIDGSDGDTKMGLVKNGENQDEKETKKVMDAKSLVKGLTVEELEERLFPHHKLMRDRTLSKKTSGDYQTNTLKVGESTSTFDSDEEKVISADDEIIALEFLASLSKEEFGPEASKIHEMDDSATSVAESSSLNVLNDRGNIDALLMADEKLNDFDDQEGVPAMTFEDEEEEEENYTLKLNDIGSKTSTGGWFVSEGKYVVLAHNDGSCSFYDIVNSEEKAEYKPPAGFLPNMWRDCWIIRAPGADGCSGKYVVAASAGNSVDSGFCSWDFYTKDIHAFHFENETTHIRTAVAPLPNKSVAPENRQWWYKPCGPLIISSASCQNRVQIYDIRDGEQIMKWDLQKPVLAMDYSSPLHWRNRGKVVIAESEAISLWDVSSLSSRALLSVSSSGRKVSALHVNNTDAELGGGVRQRISSLEAEGNDGVFCTPDSINVLDFRHPSGIGLKIPKVGVNADSAFSRGDSIYIGCSSLMSSGKKQCTSQIQQFSLRKQRLLCTYALPESNAHNNLTALTQVWGNASHVMGVCGLGLYVFDSLTDDKLPFLSMNYGHTQNVKEVIGPDDMYCPSFDYLASRILIISKDRPARWRYLSVDNTLSPHGLGNNLLPVLFRIGN